jgi:hypothetical protein
MPKFSKDSATRTEDPGPLTATFEEAGEFTVNFMRLKTDLDVSPLLRGLPNDLCSCPHWGYVIKGRLTFHYVDHDEVVEAGEAFYCTPGHAPISNEPGTEYVQFSPTADMKPVDEVILRNLEAMQLA